MGNAEAASPLLLGTSPPMQVLRQHIARLAGSNCSVFIHGESGTGKEQVARLIHHLGRRQRQPFMALNCGAVAAELIESELFGHHKGSFTGATRQRQGLFQAACGGTLLLDEVTEMPAAMQVKLLRVVQERLVRPLGGEQEYPVDVRLLSASHRRLQDQVAAGQFRADLYYRLNIVELSVPPLRQRHGDLPLLIEHLARRLDAEHGRHQLSTAARKRLSQYDFPGNVRELQNILERAWLLSEGPLIGEADLQLQAPSQTPSVESSWNGQENLETFLLRQERQVILQALESTRWNQSAAARRLGLSFRSIRYRIRKLGIA